MPKDVGLVRKTVSFIRHSARYQLVSSFTEEDTQTGVPATPPSRAQPESFDISPDISFNSQLSDNSSDQLLNQLTACLSFDGDVGRETYQSWLQQNANHDFDHEFWFSRTKLRKLCCRGLDIQWGHLVKGLAVPDDESSPVTINFDGKESVTPDVVIGADGPQSKIRTWLFGEDTAKCKETGYVLANAIVRLPGGMAYLTCQDVRDLEDPLTWSFHIARLWYDPEVKFTDGAEAIALAKSTMSDPAICERFRSAFQNMDEERSNMFVSQLHHWVTVPWNNHGGRVTLAGDAAHPIHPNRGQGLNQALNDVDKIITQFIRVRDEGGVFTVKDALDEYENDVFVRGRKAVLDSLEDTKAIASPEPGMFKAESAHGTRGLAK